LDMVINIAALKQRDTIYLKEEIGYFVEVCHKYKAVSKLIIESGLLSVDELKYICDICNEFELDFVKTSTGFNGEGAELDKVTLMRAFLRSEIGIKASGGIKNYETACAFIEAGATRIGTSAKIEHK
jgi:deoxyribose-phosphate aldolase